MKQGLSLTYRQEHPQWTHILEKAVSCRIFFFAAVGFDVLAAQVWVGEACLTRVGSGMLDCGSGWSQGQLTRSHMAPWYLSSMKVIVSEQ